MIARNIAETCRRLWGLYPILTVTGPRQSGKTTLVKDLFKDCEYVNLEQPDIRDEAIADARGFLARHPAPAIFDEVQNTPELVRYLQVMVDEMGGVSHYVLTGSHQPALQEVVSQSLAGRTGLVELLPLSISELKSAGYAKTRDQWMFDGFMPRLYVSKLTPTQLFADYFKTYVERDVRRLVNVKDLILFERFVTLLAGRVGQIVSFSALAGETGVSATTIANWISILEASFLIFRLPPHFNNISKRLVKSPKIYFTEVGLAAYLLGIETSQQLARDPLRGNLFENLVMSEARKQFTNRGRDPRMEFYRTEKGFEIDLILGRGANVRPIEVKSAQTFDKSFARNLATYAESDAMSVSPMLVYDGEPIESFGPAGVAVSNFRAVEW